MNGLVLDKKAQGSEFLFLYECPHCNRKDPSLQRHGEFILTSGANKYATRESNWWGVFICRSCGGVILAKSEANNRHRLINDGDPQCAFPSTFMMPEGIPQNIEEYIEEACCSLPKSRVVMAASALDAILNDKGYTADHVANNFNCKGDLYNRIKEAANAGIITQDMADWAHTIRLLANGQRHISAKHYTNVTVDEADEVFEYLMTIVQILFTIPNKVKIFKNSKNLKK